MEQTTQAIAEYSPTEVALNELRQKYQGVLFDVATTAGDKAAREARQALVKLRTSLEAKRKEIKAPALAYAKAIDTEAARITSHIRELEEPIDAQIKAEEQRKAAEKAEKERIERERVAGILRTIERIKGVAFESRNDDSGQIALTLFDVKNIEITAEQFDEFIDEAAQAKADAVTELEDLLKEVKEREVAAAELAAQRAELERQRKEQEVREAAERAAREEEARKLEAERAEFERQKAEFEAQKRAAEEEAQRAQQPAEVESESDQLTMVVEPDPHEELAHHGDAGMVTLAAALDGAITTTTNPQRTYAAQDIRDAFLAGVNWVGQDGNIEPGAAAEAYLASLEG